jgi:hypothetical protein
MLGYKKRESIKKHFQRIIKKNKQNKQLKRFSDQH